ncbi:MAG: thiamine-phosphate kinase [Prevotellaceae bacterium]|jgi:thiamine-monophosphate kinase|nr:thiamine-phosphate kinase [Prevotellaceae bacterium]
MKTSEKMPEKTPIATLGAFGLIDRLAKTVELKQPSTLKGIGDDAAVVRYKKAATVVSAELFLEGIHFDLTYTPLKHLGYKLVTAGVSDIYAMNATPRQILLSIGLDKRFCVEEVEELYAGVKIACEHYGVDLAGGDTTTSLTGLTLHITVTGEAPEENIVYRSGGKQADLLCLTGDLGAAYMGLQLLEREKRVFDGNPRKQPQLEGYNYILQRHLKPEARKDIIELLAQHHILPTSMIDVSDGLASDALHLCKQSNCGVRIYLERLPIASETFRLADEIHIDAVTAALHGGDDYELLFTVPVALYDTIRKELPSVDIIGHLCPPSEGACLLTPDNQAIALTAQGWVG